MTKPTVSTTGIYTSEDGFTKTAVVTGTRASTKGSSERLEKGTVNITVFSPTGKVYTRQGVSIATDGPAKHKFFPVPVLGPVTLGEHSDAQKVVTADDFDPQY